MRATVLFLSLTLAGCGGFNSPTNPAPIAVSDIFTDDSGAVWGLGAHNEVLKDGTQVVSVNWGGMIFKGRASHLEFYNHHVYAFALNTNDWWVWDGVRFTWVGVVIP